jgi:hypothetical protein
MVQFTKIVDPFYFFLSLTIGMLLVYITIPRPDVILMYPTPENAGKVVYQDMAKNCYKYEVNTIQCPTNEKEIRDITVQGVDIEKKNNQGFFDYWKKMLS